MRKDSAVILCRFIPARISEVNKGNPSPDRQKSVDNR
jgi:hypothetical protein